MKNMLNLILIIFLIIGCKQAKQNEPSVGSTNPAVEDVNPYVNSTIKDKGIRTISIAAETNSDLCGIYTVKTNGAGLTKLGEVQSLSEGPIVIPSRESFVYYGDPVGSDTTALYLFNYNTKETTRLLPPGEGVSFMQVTEDNRYVIAMPRGGDMWRCDLETGEYKKIGEHYAQEAQIRRDGKKILSRYLKFRLHDLETGSVIESEKVGKTDVGIFSSNLEYGVGANYTDSTRVIELLSMGDLDNIEILKTYEYPKDLVNFYPKGIVDDNGEFLYLWDRFQTKINKVDLNTGNYTTLFDYYDWWMLGGPYFVREEVK